MAALIVVCFASRAPVWFQPTPWYPATSPFVDAGRWIERWLPPGSRVGAFAAGYISLEASSHCVVNLDGLINDGRYMRDYVMRDRIPEYFHDEAIDFVVDNLPLAQWRRYYRAEVPVLPAGMRPLQCWPTTANQAVCVLTTAEADAHHRSAPAHPLGALLFRAVVLGEHRTVVDAERSAIPGDQQIAASYLLPPTDELRHVLLPRDSARSAIDREGLSRLSTNGATWAERVELLAVEVPSGGLVGRRCLVTTYWRAGPAVAGDAIEFGLLIGDTQRGIDGPRRSVEQFQTPAHGTLPLDAWRPGDVIAHAFAVDIPTGFPRGRHQVRIGVRAPGGDWLTNGSAVDPSAHGVVRVGTLDVH